MKESTDSYLICAAKIIKAMSKLSQLENLYLIISLEAMFKSGLKKESANSVKTMVTFIPELLQPLQNRLLRHISIALVGVADVSKEYLNIQMKQESKLLTTSDNGNNGGSGGWFMKGFNKLTGNTESTVSKDSDSLEMKLRAFDALQQFQFSKAEKTVDFVLNVVVPFLNSTNQSIRAASALSCLKLLTSIIGDNKSEKERDSKSSKNLLRGLERLRKKGITNGRLLR